MYKDILEKNLIWAAILIFLLILGVVFFMDNLQHKQYLEYINLGNKNPVVHGHSIMTFRQFIGYHN